MYSTYNNLNTGSNPPVTSTNLSNNNSVNYSMNDSTPYAINPYSNDERFITGGFLAPFILGGITGGLLAPAFNGGGYGRPVYNNYYYPYSYPYPPYYYGPCYR